MLKRELLIGALLMLAAAAAAAGQQATGRRSYKPLATAQAPAMSGHWIKCAGADGKTTCTQAQVAALNQMIAAERATDKQLAGIGSVTLAGADGTLKCVQYNESDCTDDQTQALRDAAKKKKGGGGIVIVREVDAATP